MPDRRRVVEADVRSPWSPIPTKNIRRLIAANEDAQLDVITPTAYEEDRSTKIRDLAGAKETGVITHRRYAEQVAKELGFEQYDYDEETRQIEQEKASAPQPGGNLGAGDVLAHSIQRQQRENPSLSPEASAVVARRTPDDDDDDDEGRRADTAAPARHAFRARK